MDTLNKNMVHFIRAILFSIVLLSLLLLTGFWYSATPYRTPIEVPNKAEIAPQKQAQERGRTFAVGTLNARAAYLYDPLAKKAFYAKAENTPLPLASITKIMTALVVLEQHSREKNALSPRLAEALTRMLVTSSNQSAELIATLPTSKDQNGNTAHDNFVESMNNQARALGFFQMHFANPTGLDSSPSQASAYGTAREVAQLLWHVHSAYPATIDQTSMARVRLYLPHGNSKILTNTDALVDQTLPIFASKTGLTDLAGGNLALIFDTGVNHPLVAVVLGSTEQGRFSDMQKLIRATLSYFASGLH